LEIIGAEKLYLKAGAAVANGDVESSFGILEQAFMAGLENPMRIVRDSAFYSLVDDAEYRKRTRGLIKQYSSQCHADMIRNDEAGERIFIKGKVLDERDGKAVTQVFIELVHADEQGLYSNENLSWNPRLFAYLKTDENGEFSVTTIKPGSYPDDDENDVASHVHFSLELKEYRTYYSEFTFDDDPVFKANGNIESVPVAHLSGKEDSKFYQVVIYMQRDH